MDPNRLQPNRPRKQPNRIAGANPPSKKPTLPDKVEELRALRLEEWEQGIDVAARGYLLDMNLEEEVLSAASRGLSSINIPLVDDLSFGKPYEIYNEWEEDDFAKEITYGEVMERLLIIIQTELKISTTINHKYERDVNFARRSYSSITCSF